MKQDIRNCIRLAAQKLQDCNKIIKNNKISLVTRERIIRQIIVATFWYNNSCWYLTKPDVRKIIAFLEKCAGRIWFMASNGVSMELKKSEFVSKTITSMIQQRWNWLSHCLRANHNK